MWRLTQKGNVYKPKIRPSGTGYICGGLRCEAFGFTMEEAYDSWKSFVARKILEQTGVDLQ